MALPRVQPIAPTWRKGPFDHLEWLFDVKYDGLHASGPRPIPPPPATSGTEASMSAPSRTASCAAHQAPPDPPWLQSAQASKDPVCQIHSPRPPLRPEPPARRPPPSTGSLLL